MEQVMFEAPLRILVLKDGGTYIAQGVDINVAGAGLTTDDAINSLLKCMAAEYLFAKKMKIQPFNNARNVPEFYENEWMKAIKQNEPKELTDKCVSEALVGFAKLTEKLKVSNSVKYALAA